MNKSEYLLACLSEECGEVVQVVGKSHRFGLDNTRRGRDTTNLEELKKEFHDIVATYRLVCTDLGMDSFINEKMVKDKQEKVLFYMQESINKGNLIND